jgi:hypothetical protein
MRIINKALCASMLAASFAGFISTQAAAQAGDAATLTTAGGVTSNMKQTTPGVLTSTLGIGGTNFNIVADTSKSPKALDVTEPRLGCRWNAVTP